MMRRSHLVLRSLDLESFSGVMIQRWTRATTRGWIIAPMELRKAGMEVLEDRAKRWTETRGMIAVSSAFLAVLSY